MEVEVLFFGGVLLPSETGRLVKINGIMNKEKDVELLDYNLKQSARDLSLGRRWSFFTGQRSQTYVTKIYKKKMVNW